MAKVKKKPSKKEIQSVDQLPANYVRALELVEDGTMLNKEIAKACSIPIKTFDDLISGRLQNTGTHGDLFAVEMKEIQRRTSERVRFLAKDCTKLALTKVSDHLRVIQGDDMSDNNLKKLIAVINALGKTMPKIDIGQINVQNNNFTELTPFELNLQYQRLTNVARSLSKSKRLRNASPGGSGEILDVTGAGSTV